MIVNDIAGAMIEAEVKAWEALARYKFWMFGYYAARWVFLNQLTSNKKNPPTPNPFRGLVKVAKGHINNHRIDEGKKRPVPANFRKKRKAVSA